ncbi:MAG: hypothetical protein WC314_06205 [Vulcanimicrobiota bacterium]
MKSRVVPVLTLLLLFIVIATPALADRRRTPAGWTKLGKVEGLLGEDWYSKKTRTSLAYVTGDDLDYVIPIVDGLDQSYEVNARFMGFRAGVPLEFYFFPMTQPGHTHPKFASRLRGYTKFAGLALSGTTTCLVNLGSQKDARPFTPWEVEATARHEMNHLFAFQKIHQGGWSWFLEAIAENIEQTVLPTNARMGVKEYKAYLNGYQSKDTSWAALTAERNNDSVDSYRDFGKLLSSVISFLTARYGDDAVAKILKAAPGNSVDEALQASLGKNVKQLEKEWKEFYGIR